MESEAAVSAADEDVDDVDDVDGVVDVVDVHPDDNGNGKTR